MYSKQGKTAEAEQTYQQALIGYENSCGAKHILALYTVNHLGRLYLDQGKIADAEQILLRALKGYENTRVQDCFFKVSTVYNLGLVYTKQRKTAEAVQMYQRALAGYEKIYGPEHEYTQEVACAPEFSTGLRERCFNPSQVPPAQMTQPQQLHVKRGKRAQYSSDQYTESYDWGFPCLR
jgi:tetratricopeptide (TPR) repeat protein